MVGETSLMVAANVGTWKQRGPFPFCLRSQDAPLQCKDFSTKSGSLSYITSFVCKYVVEIQRLEDCRN